MSSINNDLRLENLVSVDFTDRGYGSRIGLFLKNYPTKITVNPRGELGKIGIKLTYQKPLSNDNLSIQIVDKNLKQTHTYFLNIKSTIKWINSIVKAPFKLPLDADIPTVKKALFDLNIKRIEKQNDPENCVPHLIHTRIDSVSAAFKAPFWKDFYHWSIDSWTNIRLRFSINISEKNLDEASKALAISAYKEANNSVAYHNHLCDGKIKTTFNEIPVTTKDNFIKPELSHNGGRNLYLNGILPKKAKRDTSTGTTGKSTPWWRGDKEQRNVQKVMMLASKVIMGDHPFTAINGFALGPWATGITGAIAFANDPNASVINIGPNTNEILESIQETVLLRGEKHPIAVAGYPPYIRKLVDEAIKQNIPLHHYNIIAVVGGEPMSENQRDLIVKQSDDYGVITRTGFKQCYSSYGASDLDINIGYESDFEIELRKLCFANKHLAKELFGQNHSIPMIFHYDPLNYAIEYDENNNLIYTCVRHDRISPRVRYQLGDKGKTMPLSNVLATLKKYNLNLYSKPGTNLPLLFIWGRDGELVSFRASKIYPANVADSIKRMECQYPGINEKILHYGIYQYEKNDVTYTNFMIEVDANSNQIDRSIFHKKFLLDFLDQLKISNTDVSVNLERCPVGEMPMLFVMPRGTSPMHKQQIENPHKKKQYIFGLNLEEDESISLYNQVLLNSTIITTTSDYFNLDNNKYSEKGNDKEEEVVVVELEAKNK